MSLRFLVRAILSRQNHFFDYSLSAPVQGENSHAYRSRVNDPTGDDGRFAGVC